jgi:hypothetical protein
MPKNPKGVLQGVSAAKYPATTGTDLPQRHRTFLLLRTNGNSVVAGSRLVN